MSDELKPWPKTKTDFGREIIDKEAVLELYLSSAHPKFRDFIRLNHYPTASLTNGDFPVRAHWESLWMQRQIEIQDEQIVGPALSARAALLKRRVDYVESAHDRVKSLKMIFQHTVWEIGQNILHDTQQADAIKATPSLKRHKLTMAELRALNEAALSLDNLERQTLLIAPGAVQTAVIPIVEKSIEEKDGEADAEELRAMPATIMGAEKVAPEVMTKMLAGWFDQQPELPPPLEAKPDGSPEPIEEPQEFEE